MISESHKFTYLRALFFENNKGLGKKAFSDGLLAWVNDTLTLFIIKKVESAKRIQLES